MISALASRVQAPFWSRIPLLGMRVYPKRSFPRFVFWVCAIIYSALYFFIIALGLVMFANALWTWPGMQSYLATTLYDICYRNWWLMLLFICIEAVLVYRAATSKTLKVRSRRRDTLDWHRLLTRPVFFVAILYAILKLVTGVYAVEPNVIPVLLVTYCISVGAVALVDSTPL